MPDRPTDPSEPELPEGELPARSLSEILAELALLSHAQQGEASEMRSAVSELSRALARLFEMIRSDRTEQRVRIAQLERDLQAARDQLAALGVEPVVAPAPNDFDQLRAAAERLRVRTEQLVRDAALPFGEPVAGEPAAGVPAVEDASTSANADDHAQVPAEVASTPGTDPVAPEPPSTPVDEAPSEDAGAGLAPAGPGAPGLQLRVIDGAVSDTAPAEPAIDLGEDLDVESDLPLERAAVAEVPAAAVEPANDRPREPATPEPDTAPAAPTRPAVQRPEPIAIEPRPERKRGLRPRRRRIDARKLAQVEPLAALSAMVGAIDDLWTAGCGIDLVVAFTDGGAVRVAGGDRQSLRVEEVEPGTPARCTITATRRQLVPLLGRLELTGEESAR